MPLENGETKMLSTDLDDKFCTHKTEGGLYKTLGPCKVKLKDGEWQECIAYSCQKTYRIYVRDLETFKTKFDVKQ